MVQNEDEDDEKLKELSKKLGELYPNDVGHGGGFMLIFMKSNFGTEADKESPFKMGMIHNHKSPTNMLASAQSAYICAKKIVDATIDEAPRDNKPNPTNPN